MAKRVAVILSGCGNKDGSEITEAVSVLLALNECGADVRVFAPNHTFAVRDPLTAEPTGEHRDVFNESARIARGEISPLRELHARDFDALALPGGMGAARNLSSWAEAGAACAVEPETERVLREFHAEEKPIGAVCIAPAVVARVLGPKGITVTLGRDAAVAAEIAKTGAAFEACAVDDFVSDRDHRVVTSPAYMYADATPFQVYTGIRKAMRELVEMA